MKKAGRTISKITLAIALFWLALTIFVELPGSERANYFGDKNAEQTALIIYDPDPFYNLDQQVCEAFAEGLSQNGWYVKVSTVKAVDKESISDPDLFVFCANTYNWAPDWAICRFIRNLQNLEGKSVFAITLGSGSTKRSKRLFEKKIQDNGGVIVDSRTLWLLRPNDEERMEESNVSLATEMAFKWGQNIK